MRAKWNPEFECFADSWPAPAANPVGQPGTTLDSKGDRREPTPKPWSQERRRLFRLQVAGEAYAARAIGKRHVSPLGDGPNRLGIRSGVGFLNGNRDYLPHKTDASPTPRYAELSPGWTTRPSRGRPHSVPV